MRDIINVLQDLAEVEYWKRRPHLEARGEELACPPLIVWRYKEPSRAVAEAFRHAVESFRGTMAWEFSAAERNWILMPSRIKEYARAHGYPGTFQASSELKAKEPNFGCQANAELLLLAEHIHDVFQKKERLENTNES
ncbi:MAG: hypothetical protein ACRELG_02190 [Gemmataceae bacterium]